MLALAIALAIGCVFTLFWLRTLKHVPLVFVPDPEPWQPLRDRVSVIIPMLNEESNVDGVLTTARAQTHPNLEVIAVNDRSSDGTAAKLAEWQARWPELRVVTIEHHPEEWSGKTYPMFRGVEVATGDWFLFLDADIRLAPESIAGTAGACASRGWDALGILGRLQLGSFWERVLQVDLAALYLMVIAETPHAMMCGHYMLVRRSVYEAVGGWAMVYDEMQDDVALPRLLSEHGFLPRMRVWLDSHTVAAYRDLPDLWRATRRMIAGSTGFDPAYSGFPALIGLAAHIGPWVVIILGIVGKWWTSREGAVLMALAATWIMLAMASYLRVVKILGARTALAFTRPIGDVLAFLVQADAGFRAALGGLTWRGIAFARRRGFPERPEDVEEIISFYAAAPAKGATHAWVERMWRETERLRFLFSVLDHQPMSASIFLRVQPGVTNRHAVRLTARHWKQIKQGLAERDAPRSGRWAFGFLSYGSLLSQLGMWSHAWLRAAAKHYGVHVSFAELSPEEQRKVRAEAFLALEQQNRPWFSATPPDRQPATVKEHALASVSRVSSATQQ